MVTASLSVRYRKPVPVDTPLRIIGRVIDDKGKVIKVAGEVLGPNDILLAESQAVLVEVPQDFFGEVFNEQESWQVYPDEPVEVKYDY